MIVWRLTKARYADGAFAGEGARRFAGRWHPKGVPIVYTAESRALAAVEMLAHVGDPTGAPPLVLLSARVPDEDVERLADADLPDGWDALPPGRATQTLGEAWFASGRSLALSVPSAVIPGDRNVLLNPKHPGFRRVRTGEPEALSFDPRLRGSSRT
ncbi:MAG: RES family NAD+ phosphorylase [Myxococcota bacterium]